MNIKISKNWLRTAEIYEQVVGSKMTDEEKEQLYVYESQGKAKFKELFSNLDKPISLFYKEAFDLVNTEVLDCVKYFLTYDNWYFLYKIDKFFGHNLSREILEFILKDKELSNYQIEIQEIIWNNRDKELYELEKNYSPKNIQRMNYLLLPVITNKIEKEIDKIAELHYQLVREENERLKYYNIDYQKKCYEENKLRRSDQAN